MTTPDPRRLSRRDLLKYGAGISAGLVVPLAAGASAGASTRRGASALRGVASSVRPAATSRRSAARGGTLKFARSVAPTHARPGELDHRRRRLHARQDHRAAVHHEPGRQPRARGSPRATRLSADGMTWTFNLRPGRQVLRRHAAHRRRTSCSRSTARPRTRTARSASSTSRSTTIKAKRHEPGRVQLSRAVGAVPLGHLGVRQRRSCRRTSAGRARRTFFAKPRSAPARSRARLLHPRRSSPHPEAPTRTTGRRASRYLDAVEFIYVDDDNQRVLQLQSGAGRTSSTRSRRRASRRSKAQLERAASSCSRPGRSTCSSSTRSCRSSPTATSAGRSPTRSTARRSSPRRASAPPSRAARSSRRACSTTRPPRPVLAYSLAAAKAELAKSEVPERLLHQAADRRRRAEVGRRSPRSSSSRWRRSNIDVTITPLDNAAFEYAVPDVRLRHVHRLRDQRHQRPRRDGVLRARLQGRRLLVVLVELQQPGGDQRSCSQAEAEFDSAKRAALYAQIQAMVAEDAPFVPARLPAVHLRRSRQGQRLRGQPGRRLPPGERLADLTAMLRYTVRRLASAVLVVIGVAVATFLLLHVEPGDPAREVLGRARDAGCHRGADATVGAEPLAAGASSWRFLGQLVHGNLGQLVHLQGLGDLADRRAHRRSPRRSSAWRRCSRSLITRPARRARGRAPGPPRRPRRARRLRPSGSGCRRSGSASC